METPLNTIPQLPDRNIAPEAPQESPVVPTGPSTTHKIIVLSTFFIVLISAMIVTVFLVPRGISLLASVHFSSLFTRSEKIVLTSNKQSVASQEIFDLSWNGPIRTGSYSINYSCKDGITISLAKTKTTVPCSKEFYFNTSLNTLSVMVANTRNAATDIVLYINHKNEDGDTIIIGNTLITVSTSTNPQVVATATTTLPTSPTRPTTPNTSTNTARASYTDLVITLESRGSLNHTNTFIPGSIQPGSRAAITFIVTNKGTRASGPWSLKAILPSNTTPTYSSNYQASLSAGASARFVLGFDTISGGNVVVSINDDKTVPESTYLNNILDIAI